MNDYSDTIKDVKDSVAVVLALDTAGDIVGHGTGFVYRRKGLLVTCNHVVNEAMGVRVRLVDGEKDLISAQIVLRDEEHDLALLTYDEKSRGGEPLKLAKFDQITAGMPVIFPGYSVVRSVLTAHQGIISGITEDSTGIVTYMIDGTVNPGNSGGPLLDSSGRIVGVVNARRREANTLLEKVEQLPNGTVTLHGIDTIKMYKALIANLQMGVGYAIPSAYIPEHKAADTPHNSKPRTANTIKKTAKKKSV